MVAEISFDDAFELVCLELVALATLRFALDMIGKLLGNLPEAFGLAAEALLCGIARFGINLVGKTFSFRAISGAQRFSDLAFAGDAETCPPPGAAGTLK